MHLFYHPNITLGLRTLDPQESRHCIKSLRMKNGQDLFLTDGKGNLYKARLADNNIAACLIDVYQQVLDYPRPHFCRHIAIAPTKNTDRLEWFIEKAVELGITHITALRCLHSERYSLKEERIERLMISALKQSLRTVLPTFTNVVNYVDFLQTTQSLSGGKYIAYCGLQPQPPSLLQDIFKPNADAIVLIGPEGDFSTSEFDAALGNGFHPISLGTFRLRTETAALKVAAIIGQ